jgi:hypothetical protein
MRNISGYLRNMRDIIVTMIHNKYAYLEAGVPGIVVERPKRCKTAVLPG